MDKHIEGWVNKKINDMAPVEAEAAKANIIRVGEKISEVYFSCTERIIKALFFINSGGIIAILTYLYQDRALIQNTDIKISLLTFLLGLVFAFVTVAGDYLLSFFRSNIFNLDTRKFLTNEISFFEIRRFQSKSLISWLDILILVLGIISAICAFLGIYLGLHGYLLQTK